MASGRKGKGSLKKRIGRVFRRILVALIVLLFFACIYCAVAGINPIHAVTGLFSPSAEPTPSPTPVFTAAPSSSPTPQSTTAPETENSSLKIYAIDVGQGDSFLLISPSGKTMLIDTGESTAFYSVRSTLKELGIKKLDTVIASHPHSDHIGGMAGILSSFEVDNFYMPNITGDSDTFTSMLNSLSKSTVAQYAAADVTPTLEWDEAVTVEVLSPFSDIAYTGLNDYSIVLKVTYGNTSMLFTGDAEGSEYTSAEYGMLARHSKDKLKSTVLKVGHHGSFTSTTDAFLRAVDPEYAVISVGLNNEYGHPHASVLSKLKNAGIKIFRTDEQGTLLIELDGEKASITPADFTSSYSHKDSLLEIWERIKSIFR